MSSRKALRALRKREEKEQRLVIRHRWYAGGVATLISGALVLSGVSPAVADEIPPVDSGTTQAVETADADDSTPGSDVPEPEPTDIDSEPDPAAIDSPAIGTSLMSLAAEGPIFQPFALLNVCTTNCSAISRTVSVSGGAAVATDWEYRAIPTAAPADWYVIPSPGSVNVPRNASYTIAAVSLDPAKTANYVTTVSCTPGANNAGAGVTWNTSTRTLTFPNQNNRTASCAFTHTLQQPATIVVNKRVIRDSTDFLAGAVFRLHTGATAPTTPVNDAWATCTIGVAPATSCTITVPVSALGVSYWVVETTAPPGTFALNQIATGSPTDALTATPYPHSTGVVASGNTVQIPRPEPTDDGTQNYRSSIGSTVNGLINPTRQPTCMTGLRVGLVLDLSTSIENNAAERGAYASAMQGLVNALHGPGLPTINIQTVTFNQTGTYQSGLSGNASSTLATGILNYLNNYSNYAPSTNWDDGLDEAAGRNLDVVLLVTDGAPTRSRSTASADNVRFFHVENAVLSANRLKQAGSPVIAVGVALPGGSVTNLQAISGNAVDSAGKDYFTGGFDTLATQLKTIAQGLVCQVGIKVNKTEISAAGVETALRGGWTFGATASGSGTLSLTSPDATTDLPTQNNDGSVEWTHAFTAPNQTASVTITETPKAGWDIQSVSCNGQNRPLTGNTWTLPTFGINQSFTCTVKNKEQPTQLTLVKAFNTNSMFGAPQEPATWTLRANGTALPHNTATQVTPGVFTITEDMKAGYEANSANNVSCTGGTSFNAGTKQVTIALGQQVVCTITNKAKPAKFTFMKYGPQQAALAGGSFQLYSGTYPDGTVVGSPFAAVASGYTSGDLNWGDYYILEVTPPTGYLPDGDGYIAFTLGAGDTATPKSVALTNQPAYKDLTVKKSAVPAFDRDYDWAILKTVDRTSAIVRPGESAQFDYTVKVTPSAATDSNFTVAGTISVTNPNNVVVPLTGVTDVIPGATCSITGSPTPSVPANQTIGIPYSCTMGAGTTESTTGTNTATVTWNAASFPGTTGSTQGTAAFNFANATKNVTDATAVVSDTAPEFAAKYDLASRTVSALDGATTFTYSRGLGSNVAAGACQTYPNTATVDPSDSAAKTSSVSVQVCAPGGSIDKDVTSVTANLDGTWTVDYTLRVTNPSVSGVAFDYDLRDVFDFGAGFSVVGDPTVTGPAGVTLETDWDGASQPLVAAGVTLAANAGGTASHTYGVSVTIAFDTEAEEPGLTCEQDEPGAFRNVGAVYSTGEQAALDEDDACAEPKTPTFTKFADPAGPTLNADGTWTVKYILRVTNPTYNTVGAQALFYSLTDIAGASLTGDIQLTDAGWTATGSNAAPTWNGIANTTLVAAAVIGANEQHRDYTVTGTLEIAPGVPSEQLECDPQGAENTGIVNTATLTHVFGEIPGRACIDIERPTVTVEKTAKSVKQNVAGTWLVTYLVSVSNNSDEFSAVYDLTDVPLFGTGIGAGPVLWAPSNVAGEFDPAALTGATPLAAGKVLAKSGVDYYIVQVVADVATDSWTEDVDHVLGLPCPQGWQEGDAEDGGLLNSATVTSGGDSDTAFGCIEPKLPTIAKAPAGAVQLDDPSQWAVTFTLTVTGRGTDTFYDLADVPDFVEGVHLISGSAFRVDAGADPEAVANTVPLPVAGEDPVPFVTDVALGGSGVHEWRVTWIVSVPTQVLPPELRDCATEGGGLNNQAILTVDDVEQTSDACIPVDEKVYPDMTKVVTELSRDPGTRIWEIIYQIDVTLTDDEELNPKGLASSYDLLEELDYPGIIHVVDASWYGHGSGEFAEGSVSAQLADGEKILAGETHTYFVKVHATLATGAISPQSTVEIGCNTFEGTRQIGFFNTATLTYDELTPVVREACTPPVYPTVVKTPGTVTENEDGTQTVEYFVTVTAPAPVDGQPVTNVIYALKETPDALPSTVTLEGKWHAAKVGDDTPVPSAAEWDGEGDWNLQAIAGFSAADRLDPLKRVHTYRVWANVKVSGVPATMPEPCLDEGADGIPVWNTVTLAIGEQSSSDEACVRVNYDDVKLVKTAGLPEGQTSVEPGDEFDYLLTVTNLGTRDATGVRVTDSTINDRLEIVSVAVPGFTFDGAGYTGNDVDLTLNEPLAAGDSVVVTVHVRFLPAVTDGGFVDPDEALPTAPDPIEVLTNKACVTADADSNSDNNCDTHDIPVRDITGVVYTTCQSDAALLGFFVRTSGSLSALPVTGTWTTDAEPQASGHSLTIDPFVAGAQGFGRVIPWPGVVFSPSGVAIDYPGWRPLQASDYTADGQYIDPFDGLPMTEGEIADKIFNGLILDDSEIDYAWRGNTTIEFTVNPTITLNASYPPATPECFQARATEVQIEKTASVEKTDPGKSFTYDLAVQNVSDDSAAEGVIVTDAIPADISITNVSWPGKGDASVFPNWDSCEVTGQAAGGYGGTLECVLFGPLQPAGSNGGASAAPTITLVAMVSPSSTASVITNVAVVDYHTFGDPEDAGRDSDDAIVLLSALPATGGSPLASLIMLGFLAMLAGVASVIVIRRRRGEVKPLL